MGKIIDDFRGDFEYLSNFSPHGFVDEHDVPWETNEHFYQAHKTFHPVWRLMIWETPFPGTAKRIGEDKDLPLRKHWDQVKISIMESGLTLKFEQNDEIESKLLSTVGFKLVEGNKWHDNFWGDCKCEKCKDIKGKNWLGFLLMSYRSGITGEDFCGKI